MLGRFLSVFLAVAALAWGCGKEPIQVGGEMPERVYTRIISLSPSTTELLALLNQEHRLVGRTASCDSPETIKRVPIVANPSPSVELILAIQPEIVVYDAKLFSENNPALAKLKEARIELRPVDINSVEDWRKAVMELGNLFMDQLQASKEIDRLNTALGKGKITPTPKVIVAMGASQPMAAGINSFQADVIRNAGGELVGPDADRFVPINMEQVTSWNPDYVLVPDDPQGYLSNPAWAATNAGKNGRILRVKENLLLRPGARVPDLISTINDNLREFASSGQAE